MQVAKTSTYPDMCPFPLFVASTIIDRNGRTDGQTDVMLEATRDMLCYTAACRDKNTEEDCVRSMLVVKCKMLLELSDFEVSREK